MKLHNLLLHKIIYILLSPFPAYQNKFKNSVMNFRTYISDIGRVEILFNGGIGLPYLSEPEKEPILWLHGTVVKPEEMQGRSVQLTFSSSELLIGKHSEGELGRFTPRLSNGEVEENILSLKLNVSRDEIRELAAKQLIAGWPIYTNLSFDALEDRNAASFCICPSCPIENIEFTEAKVLGKITEISRKPEELIQ